MNRDAWHKTREIIETLLDAPASSRSRLLDELCESDDLRREIEDLLSREDEDLLDPRRQGAAQELAASLEASAFVGQCVGAYKLESLIATGGMGDVYRAVRADGTFERVAAVKVIGCGTMTPEARRRFAQERRLLARLAHPNIAALIDAGEEDGRSYIVLEYVEGEPLLDFCKANDLDTRGRIEMMATICEAVAHAHQKLIVHRDLKPANVLVTADGTPKLLDFGISKMVSGAIGIDDPSQTISRMLTPHYASPEQFFGGPVTTASDVYSLGVLLHEMQTGVRPGGAAETTGGTTGVSPYTNDPQPPSHYSPKLNREIDAIVLQALSIEPEDRYPSAEAMGADLRRYLDGKPVVAYPASRTYQAKKWARRHRVGLAMTAGVFAVVAAAGTVAGVMASRLAAEQRETLAAQAEVARINQFLTDTLESASAREGQGGLTVHAMLDDAAARMESIAIDSPRVEGELHSTLGRSYFSMRRFEDAGPHLAAAVDLLERGYGPDDLRVASAREDHAKLLQEEGAFDRASDELVNAFDVRVGLQGPDHIDVAHNVQMRGFMELIRGRPDLAETLMLRAKEICERGGHEQYLIRVLDQLGTLATVGGDHASAIGYHTEVLTKREQLYGAQSMNAALATLKLGETHASAGDLEQAVIHTTAALQLAIELQGLDARGAAHFHSTLAELLARRGDMDGADEHALEAIRVLAIALPASRHDWIYARERYAMILSQQGRAAEALAHMVDVVDAYEDLFGPDHQRTRFAKRLLGRLQGEP